MALHQVKTFDANGKLKETIPPEELEQRHWNNFKKKNTANPMGISQGKKTEPKKFDKEGKLRLHPLGEKQ